MDMEKEKIKAVMMIIMEEVNLEKDMEDKAVSDDLDVVDVVNGEEEENYVFIRFKVNTISNLIHSQHQAGQVPDSKTSNRKNFQSMNSNPKNL